MKRSRRIILPLLGACVFPLVMAACGNDPGIDRTDTPVTRGLRVFTCAHSFHVFVYRQVAEMAQSAGITDHQMAGRSAIGGSRVLQHWEVPDEKNEAKAALRAGKVDVLTLSPIWMPDEGIEKFARLGVEHNPELRITVQEFWLPNDEYVPVYPLETRKKTDHDATNLEELAKAQAQYNRDVEEQVRTVNQLLGRETLRVVPVGDAALALRRKIAAGEAPGLKRQWDLFRDHWGHPKTPLQVLSAYCHFAVIYRRSPAGLPVQKDIAGMEGLEEKDKEALNGLLQELAWEAVRRHPMSGVSAGAAD